MKIIGNAPFLIENRVKIIREASLLIKKGWKIIILIWFLIKNRVKIIRNAPFLIKNAPKIITGN